MATALSEHGLDLAQEWFEARTGLSSADLVQALLTESGRELGVSVATLVRRRDEIFLEQASKVRPHAEVAAVVEAMQGVVPMAIASGGSRRVIETTLTHQPFRDAFTALVTRDDVERGKPEPDIFVAAAHQLGATPSKCLVYEDSDEGVRAAVAAGMSVVDVRPYLSRPVSSNYSM
ncbi:HAD family phosphatase [Isoptericola croceus]|uniref:HAD family hydrolase n=1 Tax=Isoptericola croceus TaxID=3031406 RepID=UPI0027B926B0